MTAFENIPPGALAAMDGELALLRASVKQLVDLYRRSLAGMNDDAVRVTMMFLPALHEKAKEEPFGMAMLVSVAVLELAAAETAKVASGR